MIELNISGNGAVSAPVTPKNGGEIPKLCVGDTIRLKASDGSTVTVLVRLSDVPNCLDCVFSSSKGNNHARRISDSFCPHPTNNLRAICHNIDDSCHGYSYFISAEDLI